MNTSYIYTIFALMAGASFLLIIPKAQYTQYKRVLLYTIVFGGLGDAAVATILTFLGLIRYKGMRPFSILGIFPIWIPITWTYTYAIFFYLMPVRKPFLIPYVISFAALTYAAGLVFESFGLFEYIGIQRYFAPLVFLSWYSTSAWVYLKNSNMVAQ